MAEHGSNAFSEIFPNNGFGAVKGVCLFPSYHWLFVCCVALAAVYLGPRTSRVLLGLSFTVLAADVVLLLVFVGPFIGELLLAASALLYAVAAIATRRD